VGLRTIAVLVLFAFPVAAQEGRKLAVDDYRHFRALAIDLLGRVPSRDEIAEFEKPGFELDKWIDAHLSGAAYVDRLSRIWMDLLRLEVGPAFNYAPAAATLRRVQIVGPDGKPMRIYFRAGQRRSRELTDGEFCLSEDEVGFQLVGNNQVKGTPKPVTKEALEANTVVVRPWWLYADFLSSRPSLRFKEGWTTPDPLYQPIDELLNEADKTPTEEVRVCREEAQTADTGTIFASGRKAPPPVPPNTPKPTPPLGRLRPLPNDDGYAVKHAGEPLSCRSALAVSMSVDCGCGLALQYCMPGDGDANDPRAFSFPTRTPLGIDQPIGSGPQNVSAWHKLWWSQEAAHFLGRLFDGDRDFREILTARWSMVNGPLAQFYRGAAAASCCNREKSFNMVQESEPLFDPKLLPANLFPSEASNWKFVPDRGPHASGILTMPVFLTKFASRRARGAVLYNAFLCKSFSAPNVELSPSEEPNLMKRPGCSACHATLEPLAAYFSRVEETEWVFLPSWQFPLRNPACKKNGQGKLPGYCEPFYDPAFSDGAQGILRGAYASIDHAEAGPVGAAEAITGAPEFAQCAVQRVVTSFLGRPTTSDDAALIASLTDGFQKGGYRMRGLVKALLASPQYRSANNLSSQEWRGAGK
jgi:hypothetical protein